MSSAKRFKHDLTVLETLPNELFLEIFSYLTGVVNICAFSQLNNRFQSLISQYCYTFDCKSIAKTELDYIIRHHDIKQWRLLRLSDDDDTPGQVTYFCRQFDLAQSFSHLEALSIINTQCSITTSILPQLTLFNCLVSLSIGSICGKTIPVVDIVALKHLTITSCIHTNWLHKLRLETLQHTIEHHSTHEDCLIWPTTLKQLKVFTKKLGDNKLIRTALKSLHELNSLTIYDGAWDNPIPDGQIWEELIKSSLPLLKNFQFCFKFWRNFTYSRDVNRIVEKFSTPFYLQEKSWFVRCDAHNNKSTAAILYSLPYAFQRFEIVTRSFSDSISTSKNSKMNPYKSVKTLQVAVKCEEIHEKLLSKDIVDVHITYSNTLVDWIYAIPKLCQLTVGDQMNISDNEFLRILKSFPCLKSLITSYQKLNDLTNQWKNKSICNLLSQKIRSLKLSTDGCRTMNLDDYIKVDELLPLVKVFSRHCEHLNLAVYSRNIVAGLLLRCMNELQSLKVRLKEHGNDLQITKQWLIEQNNEYKKLNYSLVANGQEYSFWFSRSCKHH
ncbi:hypothetical protein I4U23_014505 [Adineta vaga]|nr:hypothetical protein I4U23_014505 [Adineta vaga]